MIIHDVKRSLKLKKMSFDLPVIYSVNEFNLFSAVKSGVLEEVKFYLKNGVNPNVRDKAGFTPLHYAAEEGDESIVMVLLLHPNIEVNFKTHSGKTPLLLASENGHEKVVNELLKSGADVNVVDNWESSALIWSAANSHSDIISELLKIDGINLDLQDEAGYTALMWGVINGKETIVKMLLEAGADLKLKTFEYNEDEEEANQDVFFFAKKYESKPIINLLKNYQ